MSDSTVERIMEREIRAEYTEKLEELRDNLQEWRVGIMMEWNNQNFGEVRKLLELAVQDQVVQINALISTHLESIK